MNMHVCMYTHTYTYASHAYAHNVYIIYVLTTHLCYNTQG